MALQAKQLRRHIPLLQGGFLFNNRADGELATLLAGANATIRRYHAGELLMPGAHAAYAALGILLTGAAVVEKQSGDSTLRMSELRPGALFGMATLFTPPHSPPAPTKITALTNASALIIAQGDFLKLLQSDFTIAENYIRYLTGRIYFLNARIEGLISPTAPQRVLLYIRQNAGGAVFTQSLTQLAQALHLSRATLYRALDTLEAAGEIRRRGRRIELIKP
ncbi:MAG: Crp/Fnr family transcriptional regulator [Clostridiales bacterium]|jgi:CRP-like cAMP-binding protein|nr:Crp/Fnr family transcriptional regulator [Clostridiales bacterium]